ncbi:hypothetical protein TWF217_001343 [Orbilia oligospora]|nr:hypothetical protein TWF217_001343 [Orbilia oligospora]
MYMHELRQASGDDIGGSGDFLLRPEDGNPDYLMEDGEGDDEEGLANEDRENYDENQMDEDYDAESCPDMASEGILWTRKSLRCIGSKFIMKFNTAVHK